MGGVKELAAAAAATLRQRGWWQGGLSDYKVPPGSRPGSRPECVGKVCLLGAVNAAANRDGSCFFPNSNPPEGYWHLRQLLNRKSGDDLTASFWNDNPARTEEQVLNLLDRIAEGKIV